MIDSYLEQSFTDLRDALDDFDAANFNGAPSILLRFTAAFSTEPLASFLGQVLPAADSEAHAKALKPSTSSFVGSSILTWPPELGQRVALQVQLVQELAGDLGRFRGFTHNYCNAGVGSFAADKDEFSRKVLRPLVRDIERLAEKRVLPPLLFERLHALPSSGNAVLDGLLAEAVRRFRDPAPASHQLALEKLWDAWECVTTLRGENKPASIAALFSEAAPDAQFRALLEKEASTLKQIGNDFRIRHFDSTTTPIEEPSHRDYLFHRLFSLIYLVVFARAG